MTRSERRLIRRLKDRDERAFSELIEGHGDRVFNLCFRMLSNREEAEDLAQEAFVRAYQRLDRFDPAREESRLARLVVDGALKAAAGRGEPWTAREAPQEIAGSRYVDWFIPGLIGMGIMTNGMWAVAYGIVQARMRKLLKRMVASPMRRRGRGSCVGSSRGRPS